MSYIYLSEITPEVQKITLPGLVSIEYTISGGKDVAIDLFYQLNHSNNIYFLDGNNKLTKEISLTTVHKGGDKKVSVKLKLIKEQTGADDYDYCFLYVQVVNKTNKLSDIKHCMIQFL
ncbi:hypothetical protein [Pedobacter psychrodurus]|uniref:hypothetical protein n=1 Tax=Pedobacter psychrodurus TaxID=2530456 RepID=UPI00292F6180|nr:hypothetical protein [Pedobacter psychrodurus]